MAKQEARTSYSCLAIRVQCVMGENIAIRANLRKSGGSVFGKRPGPDAGEDARSRGREGSKVGNFRPGHTRHIRPNQVVWL